MKAIKYAWKVLKTAIPAFMKDHCFRFSAALSFYTLFSIAPLILLAIYVAGIFADDALVRDQVTSQFESLIGTQGANGVRALMDTLHKEDQNTFSLVAGIGLLLYSATNIFIQIQTSFNEIFMVKAIEGKGFKKLVIDRLISLGMVLSLGFIMIISLILDSLVVAFVDFLSESFDTLSVAMALAAQYSLILLLVYGVIYALIRFLPDVVIPKKFIFRGSLITALLLIIGKFGIGWYIGSSNFSQLGGASSGIIILMLWVYYSSVILFFGGELIKAMAKVNEVYIRATRYAKRIKYVELNDE
ncbi:MULTISPECIES: YihY/virulence factor BrkB family protein [Roseivirga]|jgi:membrane protein|uniref:Serum resistance protein BrkB n=1 Tax=Roseivirga thermotolerans TaxID=1758176 RepID=A0ABQ3I883_9BACT|nr:MULTISPECIES: YihY/virulence factor BrkB family protein [Roseivirga]MEC7755613.1 YihY/virulence factor BrkB family protein [Bacteroidota bacterium]GHE71341.1 serum resistance protein BrkB [Roseivirga thermotolerans]|tara:strand:+ start:1168 stop:2070 length:903 start_codon:yes stop_codon:yes gene_type:complete